MEDCRERYERMLEAIDCERKAEEAFFAHHHEKRPVKEKTENGLAWYPVKFTGMHYVAGDMIEIKLQKKNPDGDNVNHRFKVGVAVQIFHSSADLEPVRGTVSYMKKEELSILCNARPDILEDFQSGLAGIEVIYDDKPYQVMRSAVVKAMESTRPSVQMLKKLICNEPLHENWNAEPFFEPVQESGDVNASQKAAIQHTMASKYVSVIHGPPGTGKTTTLVALAKNICQKEKKILVCASSNNAVDVLALRLHLEGLKVLRIGNITRVHDAMTDLTVAEKMRNHPDWATIKKMRIQADQLERQARQFKRSFSAENKEERKNLRMEAKEMKAWSKELEYRISQEIIEEAQIIATTLVSASHPLIDDLKYQTVIIDEASQALETECWNAILKAEKVVLAGDHKQLPPTVKSDEARQLGLETTLLDILTDRLDQSHLLNIQYRMHDHILGFSNAAFYNGLLLSADHVKSRTLPGDTLPLIFIDTAGCSFDESVNPNQKSYKNEGEYFILREYVEQKKEMLLGATIGIISPYAEQVRYLSDIYPGEPAFSDLDIEINTIDGFQGQEKDVIIVSLVRSNEKGETGFLKDERRLNVALTRAKKKLIVIGDSSTVGQHKIYAQFIDFVESTGGLDSAWNYMKY